MEKVKLLKIEPTIFNIRSKCTLPMYGGVYAFYSKEGYLIYIGKSVSFRYRFYSHNMNSKFKKFIYTIEMYRLDSETDREIYETYLINEWKPLFNTKKTYTYIPILNELEHLDSFNSVDEIIKCLPKIFNFKIKKEYVEKECDEIKLNNIEMCECVDKVIDYRKTYGKSDVRRELKDHGYNINEIMSKEEFDNILLENGFILTKMSIKNRNH